MCELLLLGIAGTDPLKSVTKSLTYFAQVILPIDFQIHLPYLTDKFYLFWVEFKNPFS